LSPKHVYIRSSIHVATCFIQEARRKEPELINTNLPGVRDIYLSPTGTHEQWQASLYAGFIASRSGSLTIARETLEKLFGRSQDTMRRWEQNRLHDIITVQKNLAQCAELDEYFYHIPEHAQAYVTKGKQPEVRIYWRMPNTYSVKNIRQHPRRGQASKVRKAAEQETHEPAISRRVAHSPGSVSHDCHQALFGGSGGLHTVRLYFASRKRLRAYVRKYGGVRYLYTGHNRHGHGMWEPSSDGYPDTQPRERASFKEEYWYLKAQRQKREGLG
jgi:hypothetical protein